MGFVGVDTGHSSIMKVFPRWADHLGLPTRELRGHDVPLGAPDAVYRDLVSAIRDDESHLGALVTTHKIRVFEAARDLFDELDDVSVQCGEVSSISKRDGRLVGGAKDPLTAGLALREILPAGWFADGGEVVCLGSGGAGTAITTYLAQTDDPPRRITVTASTTRGWHHLRAVHERTGLAPSGSGTSSPTAPGRPGRRGALPRRKLVVNATGMGKDRPGSPVDGTAVSREGGVVWEFNYRGSLDFLRQAEPSRTSAGCRCTTAGATSCTAGRRPWRRSSA